MDRLVSQPEALESALIDLPGTALDVATLDLDGAVIRVESNVLDDILTRFHESHRAPTNATFDWHFVLIEAPITRRQATLISRHERTYRADALARGVIVGHHLGGPIGVRSFGPAGYVFVGQGMDAVFWSLLVKVVLTMHAGRTGGVHLKAVSLEVDGRALLLVGRSKSGKTEVGLRLHELGSDLIANTHVIWRETGVTGIATSVRTRVGRRERMLVTHDLRWCLGVRPIALLATLNAADVTTPCLRYGGRGFWPVVQHFGLATVNYDLKEDICDFASSPDEGVRLLEHAHRGLDRLARKVPTVDIVLDPLERSHIDYVARELLMALDGRT